MDFSYKLIDSTHCKYNGNVYHINQLNTEMVVKLKSAGCKFQPGDRFFRLQNFYVVIVGNLGICFETENLQLAIDNFNEYVEFSKNNYGGLAGEPVFIACNGEPMENYNYFPENYNE